MVPLVESLSHLYGNHVKTLIWDYNQSHMSLMASIYAPLWIPLPALKFGWLNTNEDGGFGKSVLLKAFLPKSYELE
jgi:hypothetical protein